MIQRVLYPDDTLSVVVHVRGRPEFEFPVRIVAVDDGTVTVEHPAHVWVPPPRRPWWAILPLRGVLNRP